MEFLYPRDANRNSNGQQILNLARAEPSARAFFMPKTLYSLTPIDIRDRIFTSS